MKKSLRVVLFIALAVLVAMTALVGCQKAKPAKKTVTMAFMPGIADPFYFTMERGIKAKATELGVNLIVGDYPTTWGPEAQVPILQALMAKGGIDMLLIAPTSVDALVAPLKKIYDSGVQIITVDTFLGDGDYSKQSNYSFPLAYIGTDNELGGKKVAEQLAKLLGEKGKVFCESTNPDTSLKGGAADYLLKPIDNTKLLDSVRKNLELRALKTENRFLKEELVGRCLPYQFVTADPALRALLEKADKVKDSPITTLITGESGTGKEVLARYIHFTSTRKESQFIGLNCAALSESLLLSELFGHERGAFTGAVERKRGKFELADGGTIFLDEIGDMSMDVQAKLLRVIEESGFERLGGVKRINVNVRIVAATNKDLPALIKEGRFREDLFYRINVVSLHLPPLRERKGDIPLLIEHFMEKYGERYVKEPARLGAAALSALTAYSWPGNVRELENVISQIVLLGEKSFVAGWKAAVAQESSADVASPPLPMKEALGRIVRHHERRIIAESLARNGGNKSRTARDLNITRKTLARKLRAYGL